MKSVWKYTLKAESHQTITVPLGSEILSLKEQHEQIVLYALVSTEEKGIEEVGIVVLGTGHEVTEESIGGYTFIDTVKMDNGQLMFHVFYKQSDY